MTDPLFLPRLRVFRMLHSKISVHGMARESGLMGNQRDLGSLGMLLVNLVVAFDALLMVGIVPFLFAVGTAIVPGWKLLRLRFRKRLWWLLDQGFELGLFPTKKSLQGFREVRQEMPEVSGLLRVWRSEFRSFRIWTAAIPTHDLHTRVGLLPFFQRSSLPNWENINGYPPL